jgi:hypothetical protein
LVANAARRLAASRADFVDGLVEMLAGEIAPLQHDDHLLGMLTASARESVASGLYVLEHDIDPRMIEAPSASVQYARRLAQRGIPLSALLRAYRLGHSAFVELFLAEIAAEPEVHTTDAAAASVAALRISAAWVDTVSEQLVVAYETAREAWAQHHSLIRVSRIKELLANDEVDVPAAQIALGYRFDQTHLAMLLWFERDHTAAGEALMVLEQVASRIAAALGGVYLLVPADAGSAEVWIGMRSDTEHEATLAKVLAVQAEPRPRAAIGRPAWGVAGFRSTHRQARAARQVALAAGRRSGPVTSFADVGTIALLCTDLVATRVWVQDTLGGLAGDDEATERLRETVRVFLNLGSSHTATAERLNLHKNSVQYRIAKAESLRGRPVRADRADVELALRACRLLGPVVLAQLD